MELLDRAGWAVGQLLVVVRDLQCVLQSEAAFGIGGCCAYRVMSDAALLELPPPLMFSQPRLHALFKLFRSPVQSLFVPLGDCSCGAVSCCVFSLWE
jgi:hypothetical protein